MATTQEKPRTDAPTNEYGEPLDRYGGRVDRGDDHAPESCSGCGSSRWDVWLHHGATSARLVCVFCGETTEPEGSA